VINYVTYPSDATAYESATHLARIYNLVAVPIRADLLDPIAPAALIQAAKDHFVNPEGMFQVDMLTNNAAIVNAQPIEDLDLFLFDQPSP
jgi:NAD(P)-dependent dehydrogenase (short-subunit alcohol dehydrogenase family)